MIHIDIDQLITGDRNRNVIHVHTLFFSRASQTNPEHNRDDGRVRKPVGTGHRSEGLIPGLLLELRQFSDNQRFLIKSASRLYLVRFI